MRTPRTRATSGKRSRWGGLGGERGRGAGRLGPVLGRGLGLGKKAPSLPLWGRMHGKCAGRRRSSWTRAAPCVLLGCGAAFRSPAGRAHTPAHTLPYPHHPRRPHPPPPTHTPQRIMSVKYAFPANLNLSPELLDLIARIFVAQPAQRISIEQIKGHPWFLKNLPEELKDGGAALKDSTPGVSQTVEDIRVIVGDARSKAQAAAVRGGGGDRGPAGRRRGLAGDGGESAGRRVSARKAPQPAPALSEPCRSPVPSPHPQTHKKTLAPLAPLAPPPPTPPAPRQAAPARDFNEEDYMDGDLMDEELVE